jgi:hypothetical protein
MTSMPPPSVALPAGLDVKRHGHPFAWSAMARTYIAVSLHTFTFVLGPAHRERRGRIAKISWPVEFFDS